ncbi:Zinc finger protein [Heracleum sosnowskyi]|uniref:Zinc finger protein n=1 Tax=Heracleum sosnowskyi TaxID=360622 RepID=A0AAD8MI00_9APIA|nr:Zinc finger protein [Heracleum sosnowskyi]
MSSPKNHRRKHEEKNRKASSFHGRTSETMAVAKLNRPRTVPDLLAGRRVTEVSSPEGKPAKLTKLLLNVTVQRSLGAVMVIMSPESSVGDLIAAVLRQYVKEGRRPILGSTDCGDFDLHYSQFSLESLDREEKLINLGSRNFFLCPGKMDTAESSSGITAESSSKIRPTKCLEEAEEDWMTKIAWLKLMELLL